MNYSMMKEVISMRDGNARQPPELMHYGIKGQTWGIRRFQNEDGSYTAEGKERYNRSSSGKKSGSLSKRSVKGSTKNHRDWKPSDAENLSDDELNKRNSRLQREQQYRDATTPKWKKEAKQTIKDAAKKIFVATAVTSVAAIATAYLKPAREFLSELATKQMKKTIDAIGAKRARRGDAG